mmetsp:Transcript_30566/g.46902  ORF Transcript_30566/g.46902 Transcript_30566/m.46902 type:complete len:730 (+) Transcript_30566:131-2320(+)|eukprot:CAMPEP_0195298474 /NCGR_PEP_ID=MMETSP0707-20130614/23555_1 /TAXON_ID=33640 /ORGANISM="Asterionellopsis glacialis, Strain CCMP134" /LENGTH=729 /DNA_ID=CAMNT_0040360603 /DNA_START=27 /DNA_END=2216 /DNA_ORIENTATION=+
MLATTQLSARDPSTLKGRSVPDDGDVVPNAPRSAAEVRENAERLLDVSDRLERSRSSSLSSPARSLTRSRSNNSNTGSPLTAQPPSATNGMYTASTTSRMWTEASKKNAFAFLNDENVWNDEESDVYNDEFDIKDSAHALRSIPNGGGVSLPHVEEIRSDAKVFPERRVNNFAETRRRKKLYVRAMCLGLLLLVVGLVSGPLKKASQHGGNSKASAPNNDETLGNTAAGAVNEEKEDTERFEAAISFLGDFSDERDLADNGSPQNLAADWMANKDPLRYPVPSDSMEVGAYHFLQRYALVVFYYALEGDSWNSTLNFLSEEHTCSWNAEFPSVDNEKITVGVDCNEELHVEGVIITGNNLHGSLPREISLLGDLSFLILENNDIFGRIPTEIKVLKRLDDLDLKYNSISGTIPPELGELPMLRVLELSNNYLEGPLPKKFENLESLRTLALDSNLLTGPITVIDEMPDLEYVYLEHNEFEGIMDKFFFNEMSKLIQLDLSDNNFKGHLPDHLLAFDLTVLDVANNELTGIFPENFPENDNLLFLSIEGNKIRGTIPDTIRNLGELLHLDLSDNLMTGTLSPALASMDKLVHLFLDYNSFLDSQIPDFFGEMTNLQQLTLGGTDLTGTVPGLFDSFNVLNLLDLHDNSLSGDIESICNANPQLAEDGDYPVALMVDCSQFKNTAAIESCTCCMCCADRDDADCIDSVDALKMDFERPPHSFSPNVIYSRH